MTTTDLSPAVRDRAAERIKGIFWEASYRHEHDQYLAMVDAVVAVVAEEIERPLQARIAELEKGNEAVEEENDLLRDVIQEKHARIEELSTMLRGMTRRALWRQRRVEEKIELSETWRQRAVENAEVRRAAQARVEVLTAALTDVVTHLHPPSSDTWARGVLDRACAALNAVVVCRFCGQPEGDTVWCCDALMEADGAT